MQPHVRPVKLDADILPDMWCRRRGKRAHLADAEPVGDLSQPTVGGAEIVSPLTDAVRFIDHHRFRWKTLQKILKKRCLKPFRSDIEQFDRSCGGGVGDPTLFRKRHDAVDEGGGDAPFAQGVHLILHQRNQRRNHDAVSGTQQKRQLVAKRFSSTGRHDDAKVIPREYLTYDLLLVGEKSIETEIPFQCGCHFIHRTRHLFPAAGL